ncbi:MAG: hypothetical protein NTY36_15115 [Deltaproteobacteria bacterium]|nr:hypothetical protein [Deltaproteobacteria bacterium]
MSAAIEDDLIQINITTTFNYLSSYFIWNSRPGCSCTGGTPALPKKAGTVARPTSLLKMAIFPGGGVVAKNLVFGKKGGRENNFFEKTFGKSTFVG